MLSPTPQAPHLYRTGWVRHLSRYKKKHVQAGPLETGVRTHKQTLLPAQATSDSVATGKEGISPTLNTCDHTMALARRGISWSSCLGQDAIA